MIKVDIKCQHCKRYLGNTESTFIGVIKCSNSKCKKDNNIKIVNSQSTDDQLRYKFKEPESKIEVGEQS